MNTFTVIIETPAGPLSVRRETADAEIKTGRRLEREGIGEIFITPPSGGPQPRAEFVSAAIKDLPDQDRA
jgi:Uma2 family endonuclease